MRAFSSYPTHRHCTVHKLIGLHPGVKLCQMYNKSAEDLFFSWEAMKFGSSTSLPFTRESIEALRAKLQAELAKANAAVNKRANLKGLMSRGLGGAPAKAKGVSSMNSAMRTIGKPTIPRQDGFDILMRSNSYTAVAGPSKVSFSGPKPDAEVYKERSCQFNSYLQFAYSFSEHTGSRPIYV